MITIVYIETQSFSSAKQQEDSKDTTKSLFSSQPVLSTAGVTAASESEKRHAIVKTSPRSHAQHHPAPLNQPAKVRKCCARIAFKSVPRTVINLKPPLTVIPQTSEQSLQVSESVMSLRVSLSTCCHSDGTVTVRRADGWPGHTGSDSEAAPADSGCRGRRHSVTVTAVCQCHGAAATPTADSVRQANFTESS